MRGAVHAGLLGVTLGAFAGGPAPQQSKKPAISKAEAMQRLAVSEAGFTENVGQWDSRGKFLSRTQNVDLWITSTGAVYDYHALFGKKTEKGQVIRMSFVGGKTAETEGEDLRPGVTQFLKHKAKGAQTAHRFGKVLQKGVYSGVDARFYVDGGKPRYDLLLAPHADASKIGLQFEGTNGTTIRNGEIVMKTQIGDLINGRPVAFQWISGKKSPVSVKYAMNAKGEVKFALGAYDHSKGLVIDPLVYGSYYGGESGHDEVRNVVSDLDGGVYLVGATQAKDFPALAGPYGFNRIGGFDCFVAKLQGDAYSNIYAAYFGGTGNDFAQFCSLDPFGNLWIAGRTFSSDFVGASQPNIQFLMRDASATGGQYRLSYDGASTGNLAYNASPAAVAAALEAIPSLKDQVTSVKLQADGSYKIITNGALAPGEITPVNEGADFGLAPYVAVDNSNPSFVRLSNSRTAPTGGTWSITFTNGSSATTKALAAGATASDVQAALNSLPNRAGGSFTVTGGRLTQPDQKAFDISFAPAGGSSQQPQLKVSSASLLPHPAVASRTNPDIFVMRWAKDSVKVLNPLPTRCLFFGGDQEERLAGFAVLQNDTPNPTDPILIGFSGDAAGPIKQIDGPQTNASFIARYSYSGIKFTKNVAATKYLEGTMPTNMGGFAMDRDGNSYVAGSVGDGSNDNNPTGSGAFPTTKGIFLNGDKIRNIDVYVRKYDLNGKMVVSGLLGGNGIDTIGGIDFDPSGQTVNTGSCVTVDNQNAIYVTGIARSFNFPRTRNVLGESFTADANVFVTKISADGTELKYSTNLGTTGLVIPAGINVDPSGDAFVAGNAHPNWVDFPETNGQNPGDPEEPIKEQFPTIPLLDALDPDYTSPNSPDFPTMEGWLQVIDSTATTRIYGSWAGGFLDDMVFGPYVDRFGDVWINGWTDSLRQYVRVSSTGTPTVRSDTGSLPAALISPLAFKSTPAASGATNNVLVYGGYGDEFGQTWSPSTITSTYQRDGWLAKLRLGITPNIQSLTVDPKTVPGGLGATSTGTVTLSSAAPPGGAIIELNIDNGAAASLDPQSPLTTTTISIPAGSATGTFTIYTNSVTTNTAVNVKATYLGSFQIAKLNVVPWLQSVSVTPNTLVGGNFTNGRITLAANAPVGGIEVALNTDKPSLLTFPDGDTVTVPEGQSSAVFAIKTSGVPTKSFATVTGAVAGVNRASAITLTTANLLSLSFDPPVIPGLGTSVATLKLDGEAGSTFTVNISGLSSSYTFPSVVTFNKGDTEKTFPVTTPFVSSITTKTVTATRPASGGTGGYLKGVVSSSLTVTYVALKDLTVSPNPVEGGNETTGTVSLGAPAPAGGVIVNLSATPSGVVTVPARITIPEGALTGTFTIETPVLGADKNVTIRASRSSTEYVTAPLTITSSTFVLTLDQSSVVGGQTNVTGTVTVQKAPSGTGLTVKLKSSDSAAASVPASVVIAPGSTTATFTVTTHAVRVNEDVTITGTLGSNTSEASLEIRAIGIASVVFDSSSVRGGSTAPVTITIDAAAPAGGLVVSLSETNNLFANLPSTVTIPQGQTSIRLTTLLTKRVSRDQVTILTASTPGSDASASLRVTQAF